jgi:phospholipid/cholesterol/gamma-HCH transport system substrate-binding protein
MGKTTKVGIFVLLGLAVIGVAIFMIGDNRRLWDAKVTYAAKFIDVGGLRPGAPVRMGGVDIGSVDSVGHSNDASDHKIHVRLSIVKSESSRIRGDTIARIANKGLLGDKMIELSITDGLSAPLPPGSEIKTEEPLDLNKYVAKAEAIVNKAEAAIGNIELATRPLGDPKFAEDLKGTVASLHKILDGIANQDGAAHRLLFDPKEADKISRLLTNTEGATRELNQALADVHDVTRHLRQGPGIAHALVYDGELSANAAGVVSEFHKDMKAIREGNGLAHALLYGDSDQQTLMTNVNAMSTDLRAIVSDMRAGKGTLGGLLVDPSIYEDLKRTIGTVERNEVLRALVRYSIKKDEAK